MRKAEGGSGSDADEIVAGVQHATVRSVLKWRYSAVWIHIRHGTRYRVKIYSKDPAPAARAKTDTDGTTPRDDPFSSAWTSPGETEVDAAEGLCIAAREA